MIENIKITKLFGLYDHNITLRNIDNVTILHGPNGSGKTTIFKLLKSLSDKKIDILFQIPFEDIEIKLDSSEVKIHKSSNNDLEISSSLFSEPVKLEDFRKKNTQNNILDFVNYSVHHKTDSLYPKSINHLFREHTKNLDYYNSISDPYKEEIDAVLNEIFNLKIVNIDAERLTVKEDSQVKRRVSSYPHLLRTIISSHLLESGQISQEIDAKFPNKVISLVKSGYSTDVLDDSQLRNKLNDLSKKRNEFKKKGILSDKTDEQIFELQEFQTDDPSKDYVLKQVLSLYVEDNFKKLQCLEELYNRIILFEQLVNSFFYDKELVVDNKTGFTISFTKGNLKGQPINPSSLSSGEQHFLVLFYELVFNTKKDQLVLIDEPEISLHISWQINLVDNLREISKLNNIVFLLATHSPSIMRNHQDSVIPTGYDTDEND